MTGNWGDRVTVKQVARDAGVSTQTVSRVVNNAPGVLPETRQRVLESIHRMGYRPNAIARSLIQRRSSTLGVVYTGLDYYGPSHTLMGIEQHANATGYSLNLCLLHQPAKETIEPLIDGLLSRQVDGIVWATQEIGNNMWWVEEARLPVPIVFLETLPRAGIYNLNVNSRRGAQLAVRHLDECGYRRIGVITGPLTWWSARERLQGWRDAMKGAGLSSEENRIIEGDWTPGSGARALETLLDRFPDMEAVFACNDQMALGVLQTARRMGRRIPEDLAIIGYDDIPEAAYFWPPLTTVRQDLTAFGGAAVELMSRLITAGRSENGVSSVQPETTWLQPELIIRGSTKKG